MLVPTWRPTPTPARLSFPATVGFRLACDAAESKPRQGDLKAPTILPAKKKLSRTPKLKIRTGKPIDFGQAPTNEVSFLVCWDPAQGPSSDKDIWILWNKRSTDGGKTWNQCKFLPHTAQQLSDGTIITLGQDHLPTPNKSGHVYIQVSEDGWKTTKQTLARLELPQAKIRNGRMRIYFFQGLVEMPDKALLASCYGYFKGDLEHEDYAGGFMIEEDFRKARAILIESSDRGKTWKLRSTIANYPSFTREGCDEPDIILLPNGDLFCAMRTGLAGYRDERGRYDAPVLTAWSRCQGRSWSDVQKVYVGDELITGIFPRVAVLNNGVLAFIRSRPGTSVLFSPDGRGAIWTEELILDQRHDERTAADRAEPAACHLQRLP